MRKMAIFMVVMPLALWVGACAPAEDQRQESKRARCDGLGLAEYALQDGTKAYQSAVTLACNALRAGDYKQAAVLMGAATRIELDKFPNYKALPLYAFVELRNGKPEEAKQILQWAELSERIYAGEISCQLSQTGLLELNDTGYEEPMQGWAEYHMCWQQHLPLYGRSDAKARESLVIAMNRIAQLGDAVANDAEPDLLCETFGVDLSGDDPVLSQPSFRAFDWGCSALRSRDYDRAARLFQLASMLDIFEVPNFDVLPLLAYAQFRNGHVEQAHKTYQLAELTQRIYDGEFKCRLTERPFPELEPTPYPPAIHKKAEGRMCSELYWSYYGKDPKGEMLESKRTKEGFKLIRELLFGN